MRRLFLCVFVLFVFIVLTVMELLPFKSQVPVGTARAIHFLLGNSDTTSHLKKKGMGEI